MAENTHFRWQPLFGEPPLEPLDSRLLLGDAVRLARNLLGTLVARSYGDEWCIARVVETEAYRQDDPASHSFRGETKRTSVMFGPPGMSYVYFIYGMYNCLNVVCEPEGRGAAVLIRAVQPLWGVTTLWENRYPGRDAPTPAGTTAAGGQTEGATAASSNTRAPAGRSLGGDSRSLSTLERKALYNLTSGPGKLCLAFGITKEQHNGRDLTDFDGELVLGRWRESYDGPRGIASDERVVSGPRIGIREGVERPWRFGISGNPFLSPYRF